MLLFIPLCQIWEHLYEAMMLAVKSFKTRTLRSDYNDGLLSTIDQFWTPLVS